jgi:hypothetical protein
MSLSRGGPPAAVTCLVGARLSGLRARARARLAASARGCCCVRAARTQTRPLPRIFPSTLLTCQLSPRSARRAQTRCPPSCVRSAPSRSVRLHPCGSVSGLHRARGAAAQSVFLSRGRIASCRNSLRRVLDAGSGGVFKGAACEVLRQSRCLMSTGQITRCAGVPRLWKRRPNAAPRRCCTAAGAPEPSSSRSWAYLAALRRGGGAAGCARARPGRPATRSRTRLPAGGPPGRGQRG